MFRKHVFGGSSSAYKMCYMTTFLNLVSLGPTTAAAAAAAAADATLCS